MFSHLTCYCLLLLVTRCLYVLLTQTCYAYNQPTSKPITILFNYNYIFLFIHVYVCNYADHDCVQFISYTALSDLYINDK